MTQRIDSTIDALGLANLDEPNGLEPVEEVELPDLFDGLGGVARRYDSEESEGVTQLAAFSYPTIDTWTGW